MSVDHRQSIKFTLVIGKHHISPLFWQIFRAIDLRLYVSGSHHIMNHPFHIAITNLKGILVLVLRHFPHLRDHIGSAKGICNYYVNKSEHICTQTEKINKKTNIENTLIEKRKREMRAAFPLSFYLVKGCLLIYISLG